MRLILPTTSLLEILPLAPVEALAELLGIVDPGAAALEEAVIAAQQAGDHTPGGSAGDVDFSQQGNVLDSLAIVLHDRLKNIECRKLFLFRAVAELNQLVHAVAADK